MARLLSELWRHYAETGPADDAPTYRDIANMVAGDEQLLDVVRSCPLDTHHPNHLLAAVRYLLLGGLEHPLARAYADGDRTDACVQFRAFVLAHEEAIVSLLQTRRVQTNEVGRVAVIAPALAHIGGTVTSSLALLDVGASAGLNLLVDRCHIDYGDFAVGADDSPLKLRCSAGRLPPDFGTDDLRIGWRMGLDRAPIELDDESSARWLLSCVWVDQTERIERLGAAIELSRGFPSRVMAGDAVVDLPAALATVPTDLHLVVLTSWVTFYLDQEQRRAFETVLGRAGRPVSWLSLEHPGVVPGVHLPPSPEAQKVTSSAIVVVAWSGVEGAVPSRHFLGWAHPHGSWIDWAHGRPQQGPMAT